MGQRIIILLWLFSVASAEAAQTLLVREMFENVGTITSGAPGTTFDGVITGTFYKRPVGPRTSGISSPGWSADPRAATALVGEIGFTNSPAVQCKTNGIVGAWFRFRSFAAGTLTIPLALRHVTGGGQNAAYIQVTNTGSIYAYAYPSNTPIAGPLLSTHTWYYMAIGWQRVSGTTYNIAWYLGTIGSTLTNWVTQSSLNLLSGPTAARIGALNGVAWSGRVGGFGVYSLGSLADVVPPVDLIAPVEEGHNWYLDHINGNDNNTGLVGFPWQTAEKFNVESFYSGLIGTLNGYVVGDTVTISNGFILGTNNFNIRTRGLTLKKDDSASPYCLLVCSTNLVNASFSLTPNLAKTYQTSDTRLLSVVWEDDKWMTHPNGATFASVSNSMETTPGSFWTDGTTLYVHPFGDSNPTTDGKVYSRSIRRGATTGESAILMNNSDLKVDGFRISHLCLTDNVDSSDPGVYGVQVVGGAGGTGVIANCWVTYAGKHSIGMTDASSSSFVTITNCIAEQGSPYLAQTPFVSYNGVTLATNNSHFFIDCVTTKSNGLIGSTNGSNGDAFISHNIDGGPQFSSLKFERCNFSRQNMSISASLLNTFTNSTFGFATFTSAGPGIGSTGLVDRCVFDGKVPGVIGSTMIMRNSLVAPRDILNAAWLGVSGLLSGTARIYNTTIDLSNIPSSSQTNNYIWKQYSTLTFEFFNNVFRTLPGSQLTLIGTVTNATATLLMTNNIYQLGTVGLLTKAFDDGATVADRTLAQWKTLGFDAGSVDTNPCLNANLRPYSKTPTWTLGTELGPLEDYTGKLFQNRRTAGAYEYVTDNPRALMFRR